MMNAYGSQITEKYEDLHNAFFFFFFSYQQELDLYSVVVLCVADIGGWYGRVDIVLYSEGSATKKYRIKLDSCAAVQSLARTAVATVVLCGEWTVAVGLVSWFIEHMLAVLFLLQRWNNLW
jgi:hypothetical protein